MLKKVNKQTNKKPTRKRNETLRNHGSRFRTKIVLAETANIVHHSHVTSITHRGVNPEHEHQAIDIPGTWNQLGFFSTGNTTLTSRKRPSKFQPVIQYTHCWCCGSRFQLTVTWEKTALTWDVCLRVSVTLVTSFRAPECFLCGLLFRKEIVRLKDAKHGETKHHDKPYSWQ